MLVINVKSAIQVIKQQIVINALLGIIQMLLSVFLVLASAHNVSNAVHQQYALFVLLDIKLLNVALALSDIIKLP